MVGSNQLKSSEELSAKEAERHWNEASDRLRLANDYAHGGLKGLFLANGGAIVALLTFLGNAKTLNHNSVELWCGFFSFSIGLGSVLAAYIAGYVSHAFYMQAAANRSAEEASKANHTNREFDSSSPDRKGSCAEWTGIGFAIAALMFFLIGAFMALAAIT